VSEFRGTKSRDHVAGKKRAGRRRISSGKRERPKNWGKEKFAKGGWITDNPTDAPPFGSAKTEERERNFATNLKRNHEGTPLMSGTIDAGAGSNMQGEIVRAGGGREEKEKNTTRSGGVLSDEDAEESRVRLKASLRDEQSKRLTATLKRTKILKPLEEETRAIKRGKKQFSWRGNEVQPAGGKRFSQSGIRVLRRREL